MADMNISKQAVEALGNFLVHYWVESAYSFISDEKLSNIKVDTSLLISQNHDPFGQVLWSGGSPYALGYVSIYEKEESPKSYYTVMQALALTSDFAEDRDERLRRELNISASDCNYKRVSIVTALGVMPLSSLLWMKGADVFMLSTSLSMPALMVVDDVIFARVELYVDSNQSFIHVLSLFDRPAKSPYRHIPKSEIGCNAREFKYSPLIEARLSGKKDHSIRNLFAGDTFLGSCNVSTSQVDGTDVLRLDSFSLPPSLDSIFVEESKSSRQSFEVEDENFTWAGLEKTKFPLVKWNEFFRDFVSSLQLNGAENESIRDISTFYHTRYEHVLSPSEIGNLLTDIGQTSKTLSWRDLLYNSGDDSILYNARADYSLGHPCDKELNVALGFFARKAMIAIQENIGVEYCCIPEAPDLLDIRNLHMDLSPDLTIYSVLGGTPSCPYLLLAATDTENPNENDQASRELIDKQNDYMPSILNDIHDPIRSKQINEKGESLTADNCEFICTTSEDFLSKASQQIVDNGSCNALSYRAFHIPVKVFHKSPYCQVLSFNIYVPVTHIKNLHLSFTFSEGSSLKSSAKTSSSTMLLNLEQLFYLLHRKNLQVEASQIISGTI